MFPVGLLSSTLSTKSYSLEEFPGNLLRAAKFPALTMASASNHNCPDCSLQFNTIDKMCHHLATVHKREDVYDCKKCPLCEMKFSTSRIKSRHVRESHGNPGHQCQSCTLTFSRVENLRCHFKTVQKSILTRHIRTVHTSEKPFVCTDCSATFSRKDKLEAHKKNGKHRVELHCQYCKQTLFFPSRYAQSKHFIEHQGKWTCRSVKR